MIAFAQSSIIDQKQKTIVQCSICGRKPGISKQHSISRTNQSTPDFFRSFQDWQFPLVSYLRWPFPAERLRKMFLQNTTWMHIRTLRYIITPEGQSWRRFLATQFTLIFEVEVFLWPLSWKVWNTCEVRRKQRNS